MPQCHWFLDRTPIGAGTVPASAESQAFYCESCGDVWARLCVSGASRTLLVHRPCVRHNSASALTWNAIPGTLASWRSAADSPYWDTAHCLEYMPRSVLKREFDILVAHLDRSNHEQEATPLPDTPQTHPRDE